MDQALKRQWMMAEQDQEISDAINREQSRLRNFIRMRVPDPSDAEDILQEVFYELVQAYRMMKPVEQVTAWLFRVARNRITDLFRKKKPDAFVNDSVATTEEGELQRLEDLLPSPDAGPEAAYARSVLLDELEHCFFVVFLIQIWIEAVAPLCLNSVHDIWPVRFSIKFFEGLNDVG